MFKCQTYSGTHMIVGRLDLLVKALHQEKKRKKKEKRILTKPAWTPLLGFEVNKPSKILIKILNTTKYIQIDI